MIWILAGVAFLTAAFFIWRQNRPGTSWYGLPPDDVEAIFALPILLALIAIGLGAVGLVQLFA